MAAWVGKFTTIPLRRGKNPDNPNVDLDIKDGDVITTILDTDSEETAANDAKLIFNQVQ